MYKEQIDTATAEVKSIEKENKRILDKAGCRSESELYAKQKAKAVLQEMYGMDFSEYGFRDACIKAEMQLQNADKNRS